MIVRSVGAAILIAGLVLAISYAISPSQDPGDTTDDTSDSGDNTTPPSESNYVLRLNAEIDAKFLDNNIDGIYLHGNATASVYAGLLDSYIIPITDTSKWNVSVRIVDDVVNEPSNIREETFNITATEISEIHNSFLSSLNKTEEVNKTSIPSDAGSVPNLLHYNILYDDGTGLTFNWLGFEEVDILEVQNITWTGTPSDFSRREVGETHYLSPLSAFDSFLSDLQEVYTQHLE